MKFDKYLDKQFIIGIILDYAAEKGRK